MILSTLDIQREMKEKNIVIEGYNEEQLNPNSYDVRLGNWFWQVIPSAKPNLCPVFYGPFFVADDHYFKMKSGNTYLAITKEKVGSFNNITAMIHAKSSTRRNGISICDDAGFGDVGFFNYWTLELTANIPTAWVMPGMKIGQIAFHYVKTAPEAYDGQYQGSVGFHPHDMVPRRCRMNITEVLPVDCIVEGE